MANKRKNLTVELPPEGFNYYPDFITASEEKLLLSHFEELAWEDVIMHGVMAKRKVMHYGLGYTYDTRNVTPTVPPPDFLLFLLKRGAKLLGVMDSDIEEVLISKYPAGAGIGWHRDAPMFDKVLGVSLGSNCTIKLRKPHNDYYEVYQATLKPGSVYILSGPARTTWYHHIPAVKDLRYSVTLRTLRKKR